MDEGLYVDLGVMPTILTAGEVERLGDKAEACHRLGDTLPDVADALLAEYPPEDLKSPDFMGDPMTVAMLRRRWPNALHSVLMRRAYALLGAISTPSSGSGGTVTCASSCAPTPRERMPPRIPTRCI